MKKITTQFIFKSIYFVFFLVAAYPLMAQVSIFDNDKPAAAYDNQFSQAFNTTWDATSFYNQWITLNANAFSSTDITGGSLQFAWANKRVMISQKKYSSPYLFETELDYSTGSNRGGVVIRFNQVYRLDEVQEPATTGPGFNSRGIAFYSNTDGKSMIVQFTGDYIQNATPVTRILVPKPAGVNSLLQKGKIRIEDFGTSIYVYYNDLAFCRINLADKVGSYFTSGTVYDANMSVLGSFANMRVDQLGQLSVAQRDATLRLYSVLLKSQNLNQQTITFNEIGVKKDTDSPFALTATSSSGLPVSYVLVSGPATINGNSLSLTGTTGLVIVKAIQSGNTAYFPTEIEQGFLVANSAATIQTIQNKAFSDNWVATDGVGRTLPQYADCSDYRQGKYVGIGYYNYHQIFSNPSKFQNFPELLKDNPASPAFEWNVNYYWGKPENGFYHPSDPWVIRRHLQLLANAGVDFLYFDFTNGDQGDSNLDSFMAVAMDMYNKGIPVPKVSFFLNENYQVAMESIFKRIITHPEYDPLIFKWQGKPLLMADSAKAATQYPKAAFKGIKDYFTWRKTWAGADGQWNFMEYYPQRYFTYNGQPEQMPVSKAIGAPLDITKGTSYQNGQNPPYDQYWETDQTKFGYAFTEHWSRAFQVDPSIVCINGFNELRARAWISDASKPVPFMGKQWNDPSWRCVNQATCSHKDASGNHTPHGWYVVDEFNTEFNRDIEPSNDENTDNFYYQAISNIRKFKGMAATQAFSAPTTIAVDGNFAEWAPVTPVYRDAAGDVQNRNFKNAYGTSVLTNSTARNDIVESRATYDANNIYFYVKTVAPISPSTDPNWMLLFIDADRNKGTGWEGYDYVVNLGVTSASQTTLKQWSGSAWGNAVSIPYKVVGNEMELNISRSSVGMDTTTPEFYFHWADNPQQLKDITAFFTDGESAPDRRFNYNFSTSTIVTLPQTPFKPLTIPGTMEFEDFDNGGAGVAYADATLGNQGGAYRADQSVDIEAKASGGYNIDQVNTGEWLKYTVNVNAQATFTARINYAANGARNEAILYVDDIDKTGIIPFASTGNLSIWSDKLLDIQLAAGKHVLKFFINNAASDFKLDKIIFTDKAVVSPQVPFTPGNLVVARIGDGTTATISGSTNYYPVALQEFKTDGTLVQTIPLASGTPGSQLTISGNSQEVSLNLSANKAYLSLLGYDAGPTNKGTNSSNFSKVVGRLGNDGVVDYTTKTPTGDGNTVRQVTSNDGTGFWFGGNTSGVRYVPYGNTTTAPNTISSGTGTNVKAVDIFNGQLYGMGFASAAPTLYSIGTGLPTTAATNTPLAGGLPSGSSSNNNGFVFFDVGNTGSPNLLYTSDGIVLRKYTYSATPINYISGFPITAGSGYTSAPTVTLSNGQSAIATIGTSPSPVTGIYTWTPASYSSAPTVTITGGGGTGATATATLTSGSGWVYNGFVGIGTVSSVTVTGGVGYTQAPTVGFTGGNGSGATATATLPVSSISVASGGTGYTSAPTVSFTGGGGAGLAATATISGGAVTGFNITNFGSGYTSAPNVVFNDAGTNGSGATGTVIFSGSIIVNVTNPGSKYTGFPTVTITGGTFTSAATATAVLHGLNSAGLTGTFANNKAELYVTVFQANGATGSNNSAFVKIVDYNSVGAAPATTNTLLAKPPSNYIYKGVAFAPNPIFATWTGTTNTNWNTGTNWLSGTVPSNNISIVIPSVASGNYPILPTSLTTGGITVQFGASLSTNAATAVTGNITVNNGGTFTTGNATTVTGNLTNSGTLTVNATTNITGSFTAVGSSTTSINTNTTVNSHIIFPSTSSIAIASGMALTTQGNIGLDSSGTGGAGAGIFTGAGKVVMNSSSFRTFGCSFNNLDINKISGSDSMNGTPTINGFLNLIAGQLNGGAAKLTFGTNASAQIGPKATLGPIGSGATIAFNGRPITFKSDATGTAKLAICNAGSISGATNVTVERYIPAKAARYFSFLASPVTQSIFNGWQQQMYVTGAGTGGQTCGSTSSNGGATDKYNSNWFDRSNSNSPSMHIYNATAVNGSRWVSIANTNATNLVPGKGFRVNVRGDRTQGACSDQLNSTISSAPTTVTLKATGAIGQGNVMVTLNSTNSTLYSLVGNPYPSPVDFATLYAANTSNMYNSFWSLSPSLSGNYSTYNNGVLSNNPSGYVSTGGNSSYLASGQAILVLAKSAANGGSGTISFTESTKTTGTIPNTAFFGTANNQLFRVAMTTTDSSKLDEAVVRFNSNGSNAYNPNWDALSLSAGSQTLASLKAGTKLAIATRPDSLVIDTVKLILSSVSSDNFQLLFSDYLRIDSTKKIVLRDKYLGISHDVRANQIYNFTVTADTASKGSNRFEVIFTKGGTTLPVNFTAIGAVKNEASVTVNWKVAQPINIAKYNVDRSINRVNFTSIATVNATSVIDYTITDSKLPDANVVYYRIQSVEQNGTKAYSQIAQVSLNIKADVASIYPNPVKEVMNVSINANKNTAYSLRILNLTGKEVANTNKAKIATKQFSMNVSNLVGGVYMVEFTNAKGEKSLVKMIKE